MSDHSELKKAAEALIKESTCAAATKFEDAATPAAVLALIAEVEGLRHGWYSDECCNIRFWPEELSESKQEIDRLEAEIQELRKDRTDWQAECLKRGFEYVREPDDHYVLADLPEMADLLGVLLGVEVRSKDNDSYGETVSALKDAVDSNSDAFHRAYEAEKECKALRKALVDVRESVQREYWDEYAGMEETRAILDAAMSKGAKP